MISPVAFNMGMIGGILSVFSLIGIMAEFWPKEAGAIVAIFFTLLLAGFLGFLVCAALATIIEGGSR